MSSAIELRIDPRERRVGRGVVHRLLPHRTRRMVGPFVFADVIGPDELAAGGRIDIDAHPHIGLSTVTYLLDGRLVHRDSTGAVQTITPGAVNWMTAGAGVTHTERSHPDDDARTVRAHGVQTWVALPEDAEESTASFHHAGADDVPVESAGASSIRIAVGTGWGVASPVPTSSPLVLARVDLVADSPVPVDTPHPEVAVIALSGEVWVGHERLDDGQLAVLDTAAAASLRGDGRALVIGGEPVGPRHIWWNFVHSDLDRIEQAKADWQAQRFPLTPDDHDPFVPLPA